MEPSKRSVMKYSEFRTFRRDRNIWKNGKVMNPRIDWITRVVYCHFLEYPFLKLALYYNLSPNQVSKIGILLGILGSLCFLVCNFWISLLGCVFLHMCILADWIDGDVARFRDMKSLRGVHLDKIMFDTTIPILFFSVGWATYYEQQSILLFVFGSLAAFSYIANKHIYNLKILSVIVGDRKKVSERLIQSKENTQDHTVQQKIQKKILKKNIIRLDWMWTSKYIIILVTFGTLLQGLQYFIVFYGVTCSLLMFLNYRRQLKLDFEGAFQWICKA